MSMVLRTWIAGAAAVVAVVLSVLPVITGEREIAVGAHHLDHAVLMLFGVVIGLALYARRDDRESPAWLWVAVLCPILIMIAMAPSFYAVVDAVPFLHALNHLVFVGLAAVTAYAGQRYVRGVGWASAVLLEFMAFAAVFGYGVAPVAASVPLAVAPTAVTVAPASAASLAHGAHVFAQNCAACHGAHGEGGVGPALRNEASRKNLAQAIAWIENPAPPMPKLFPTPLTKKDVEDVAAFVESLK